MNNEIKEILDKPKILMLSYGNYISLDDYVKLKDYITNLQKENKRLKRDKNMIFDANCNLSKVMNNYKTRIDKAIEYIQNDYDKNEEVIEYCNFEEFYKHILKILKGE